LAKKVVVVGSGTGGTMVANLLASKLHERISDGEVTVELVGEGFRHYFQPANLDIAMKGKGKYAASRSELELLRKGVEFFPEPASHIDLEERTVTSVTGTGDDHDYSRHSYDYLVVATGATAVPGLIPGLDEGSLNFHTGPSDAGKVWEAVRGFRKGKVVVAIAGVPHKCPPSPDEALFLLDEHFRREGVRDDIELKLLTPYPRAYPSEQVAKVVGRLFEERGIKTVPFFNVESVDPEGKKVYSLEGDECGYDLLIAIPPHRGVEAVRNSEFADEEGWVKTDRKDMRIKGRDDAFAIGDATDIPISKSGVVAHLESKAVAMTIASELEGTGKEYEYNGRINCPMETGHKRAMFVSATYESPPAKQTPTLLRYAMKRGFGSLYWSTLSGRWEWLMDAYFGDVISEQERKRAHP
jgi:sulfide:quinone oxidoreductase